MTQFMLMGTEFKDDKKTEPCSHLHKNLDSVNKCLLSISTSNSNVLHHLRDIK